METTMIGVKHRTFEQDGVRAERLADPRSGNRLKEVRDPGTQGIPGHEDHP
jgi:hypothetical protein